MQESKLARVTRPGMVARGTNEVGRRTCGGLQGCKRHERGRLANLRRKKLNSHRLAEPARLQEARARSPGELAAQEIKLASASRASKVARGTSEPSQQGCKRHERGRLANLRRKKLNSHRLAEPARLQEARARSPGELAAQEIKLASASRASKVARGTSEPSQQGCKRHERGRLANLRRKKLNSHRLAEPARLQEARARSPGELAAQEIKLASASRASKVARGTSEPSQQGCKRHERGRLANLRRKKLNSHRLAEPARLQEARARSPGELAAQEIKLASASRASKVARGTSEPSQQGCKRHERGRLANLRRKKLNSHRLAEPARLQEARARSPGELAAQEIKLASASRASKVARGTSEPSQQGCKRHERGRLANLRRKKLNSHRLAEPARLQEARARSPGELAAQEIKLASASRASKVARGTSEPSQQGCKRHERGGSANLRCKKATSHNFADTARLQEALARWLAELAVLESNLARVSRHDRVPRGTNEMVLELAMQESKLARVTRPGMVARGTREVARRIAKQESIVGRASRPGMVARGTSEARARWLGELAVQEIKLASVSRPAKVARGRSEVARRTYGARKPGKVARGSSEVARRIAKQESIVGRASRPGKVARGSSEVARRIAKQESIVGRASRPGKVARGSSEVARRIAKQESIVGRASRPGKVARGSSEVARRIAKQESIVGRASRPGKVARGSSEVARRIAKQESIVGRASRPGKVARGSSEVARRIAKQESIVGRASRPGKVARGSSEVARRIAKQESIVGRASRPGKVARGTSETQQGCKRHERGCLAILRRKKLNSHLLADPPRLQEAGARWLGELTVQESKLAQVSRPGKVARGTSEVARQTCGARKRHERGCPANLRRKKLNSHLLADPPRLQEAGARWLGELTVQESKLAQQTRQGSKRHERGGSANLRCTKGNSHGLADPARLQEARARLPGELAAQEIKLASVSRPAKVAGGRSEVARRTYGARKRHERGCPANLRRKKLNSHLLADPPRLQEAGARWLGELTVQESKLAQQTRQGSKRHERGGSANLRCTKGNSHGLADPARLQEARARLPGELAAQEIKLASVSRPAKVAGGRSEVARRTYGARKRHERGCPANLRRKKLNSHLLADPPRLQEAGARWLGELTVQESKLAQQTRQGSKRHERGGSANLRCTKGNSHGLADPARLQEARARLPGELAAQEIKLASVSRPAKVAGGRSEVARRTYGARK
ncbi:hypothetical protein CRG98_040716 [Punica granatum]|uniref:Uncharacterized protein n=1 Tax=Punica granatum TaxID=22663 RepID=A0A2I0I500_PUNGR|nr:hypothetical protein CRG98_040716 [Punica granatum]